MIIAIWLPLVAGCDATPNTSDSPSNAGPQPAAIADATPTDSAAPALEPAIRWEFQGDDAFESSPAVADNRVIVADVMGKIYAIDYVSGDRLWMVDFDTGFLASPLIHDGTIFIGDVEGNVYCLQADDGSEKWRAQTGGQIDGAAAIYQDRVLVASQDGKLYCFKQSDGALLWEYQTDDQIRCSPQVAGNRTFLGGCDGRLHVVDLDTGQAATDPLPLDGPTGSTPAVRDSMVIVPIMDGVIYAFDWQDQQLKWTHQDDERPQEYRSSPAMSGDLLIVSSQFKQVDAISLSTGERVWRHTLRRRADASPVIAGDSVWIAATDGRLIQLDLATGQPRAWSYESRGEFYAAPTIVDDELLIADDNGVVRCFSGINDENE
jgi:outer membrane protein assembly factor BamB